MKKAIVVFCVVLIITSMASSAMASEFTNVPSQEGQELVTGEVIRKNTAITAGMLFVMSTIESKNDTKWNENTIINHIIDLYYDEQTIIGYCIELQTDEEQTGYVVVSANTAIPLIIEFSYDSKPIYKELNLNEKSCFI